MKENQLTVATVRISSLEIAELANKQHKELLRAIRTMEPAWEKVHQRKFALMFSISELPNGGTREDPYYTLSKAESLYIATKFNDEARAKLVKRWQELEIANQGQYQIPQSFSDALLLAANQAKQIENQQRQLLEQQTLLLAQGEEMAEKDKAIAELNEKTCYLDQILNSKHTITITQIAQDYGYSAVKFNHLLRELKVQRKVGGQWILYAPYNTRGYVHSETFIPEHSTTGKVVMVSRWTQKGRLFLYGLLKKHGTLPLIEQ